MRAAFLARPGVVEVGDFPVPVPDDNQILVKMHHVSICGSDVHVIFDGFHSPDYLGRPGYPGHEGVGIVEQSDFAEFPVGSAVLTVPNGQRGTCYAEYQAVNIGNVIALPEDIDLKRTMLAQQLGTTIFALKKFLTVADEAGERHPKNAAVLGVGSAGLFFLQQLLARGIEVIVSDLNEGRLAIAQKLGATRAVHEPIESVIDAATEATNGIGLDLVIEAAGFDRTRAAAVEAARIRGIVGFFGYPQVKGLAPFPVERSFRKSLTMEWISGTQAEEDLMSFRAAVDAIQDGSIEVDYCLEAQYDLEDAPAAFAAARDQGLGKAKVGITMPGIDE